MWSLIESTFLYMYRYKVNINIKHWGDKGLFVQGLLGYVGRLDANWWCDFLVLR